jgi:homogentisate solanesyltransferase
MTELNGAISINQHNHRIVGFQVNKPFLPIAAKLLTPARAWQIVLGCLAAGVGIVTTQFPGVIAGLYACGLALGTLYSVPPVQLKRCARAARASPRSLCVL